MKSGVTIILVMLSSFVAIELMAQSQESIVAIAHVEHPLAKPYKAFLNKSYLDANLKTKFIPMPAARRYIQANKGNVDAVGASTKSAAIPYQNLVPVPVVIGKAKLKLLCVNKSTCNKNALVDPNVTLFATTGIFKLLEDELNKKVVAEKYKIESFQQLNKLVNDGKIDYWVASNLSEMSMKIDREYKSVDLGDYYFYHFVHRSHTDKIPRLTTSFRQNIQLIEEFINN